MNVMESDVLKGHNRNESLSEELKAKDVLLEAKRQENNHLKSNIIALKNERDQYQKALSQMDEVKQYVSDLKPVSRDASELLNQQPSLQEKVQLLTKENKSLKDELKLTLKAKDKEIQNVKLQLKTIMGEWSSKEKSFIDKEVVYHKEISDLQQQLKISEDEVCRLGATLQKKQVEINEKLNDKEIEILNQTTEVENLQSIMQGKEEHSSVLEKQLLSAEQEIKSLQSSLVSKTDECAELDKLYQSSLLSQSELKNRIDSLNSELDMKINEFEHYKMMQLNKLKELESINVELGAKVQENENNKALVQESVEALTKGLEENDQKYNEVISELQKAQTKVSNYEVENKELGRKFEESQQELSDYKENISTLELLLKEGNEKLALQEKSMQTQLEEVKSLAEKLTDSDNRITDLEASVELKEQEISNLNQTIDTKLMKDINNLKSSLSEKEMENDRLTEELKKISSELADSMKSLDDGLTREKELTDRKDALNLEMQKVLQQVSLFESSYNENNSLMDVLKEKNSEMEERICKQKEQILQLDEENKRICNNVELKNEENLKLSSEHQSLGQEFKRLEESTAEKDALIESLKENKEKLNLQINEKNETIETMKEVQIKYETSIEEEMKALKDENNELHNRLTVDVFSSGDTELNDRLEKLQEEVTNLSTELEKEREISVALNEEIESNRQRIIHLKFIIKSLENDNSNLKRCHWERNVLNDNINESIQRNSELVSKLENTEQRCKQSEMKLRERDSEMSTIREALLRSMEASQASVDGDEECNRLNLTESQTSIVIDMLDKTSLEFKLKESQESYDFLKQELSNRENSVVTLRDYLRESLYENISLHTQILEMKSFTNAIIAKVIGSMSGEGAVPMCTEDLNKLAGADGEHVKAIRDYRNSIEDIDADDGNLSQLQDCLLDNLQWVIGKLMATSAGGDADLSAQGIAIARDSAPSVSRLVRRRGDTSLLEARSTAEGGISASEGGTNAAEVGNEGENNTAEEGSNATKGDKNSTEGGNEGTSSVEGSESVPVEDSSPVEEVATLPPGGVEKDALHYVRLYYQLYGEVEEGVEDTSNEWRDEFKNRMCDVMNIIQENCKRAKLTAGGSLQSEGSVSLTPTGGPQDPGLLSHSERDVQQKLISQLSSVCTQLLHYYSVSEALTTNQRPKTRKSFYVLSSNIGPGGEQFGASPNKYPSLDAANISHDISNTDGFIDDLLWNQEVADRNPEDGGPPSLPSLTTLVETYGEKLKAEGTKKPSQEFNVDDKDAEIRNKLSVTYPNLLACLNGQLDLLTLDGIKEDVQKLLISLEASAGMLKVKYLSKHEDVVGMSTPRNLSDNDIIIEEEVQNEETVEKSKPSSTVKITEEASISTHHSSSGNFSSEFTVLKPNHDVEEAAPKELLESLRKELEEAQSELHRLQGLCYGLQEEKKKLMEENDSLDKYSTSLARKLRVVAESTESAANYSTEESLSNDCYSVFAERAFHLLRQIKADRMLQSPRELQFEVILEGLLGDYTKMAATATEKAEDLNSQLKVADRQLKDAKEFIENHCSERDEEFELKKKELEDQLMASKKQIERLSLELDQSLSENQRLLQTLDEETQENVLNKEELRRSKKEFKELSQEVKSSLKTDSASNEDCNQLVRMQRQLDEANERIERLLIESTQKNSSSNSSEEVCPHCNGNGRSKRLLSTTSSPVRSIVRRQSLQEELSVGRGESGSPALGMEDTLLQIPSVSNIEADGSDKYNTMISSMKKRLKKINRNLECVQISSLNSTHDESNVSPEMEESRAGDMSGWLEEEEEISSASTSVINQKEEELMEPLLASVEVLTEAAMRWKYDNEMSVKKLKQELTDMTKEKDLAIQSEEGLKSQLERQNQQFEDIMTQKATELREFSETMNALVIDVEEKKNHIDSISAELGIFDGMLRDCGVETREEMVKLFKDFSNEVTVMKDEVQRLQMKANDYEVDREELERRNEELSEEVETLRSESESSERSLAELMDKFSRLQMDVDEMKSDKECLQSELTKELHKVASLQARLEDYKRSQSSGASTTELVSQLSSLQRTNEETSARLLQREKEVAELRYSLNEKKKLVVWREREMMQLREKGGNAVTKETQTSPSAEGVEVERRLRELREVEEALEKRRSQFNEASNPNEEREVMRRMSVGTFTPMGSSEMGIKLNPSELISPAPSTSNLEQDYRVTESLLTERDREVSELTEEGANAVWPIHSQVQELEKEKQELLQTVESLNERHGELEVQMETEKQLLQSQVSELEAAKGLLQQKLDEVEEECNKAKADLEQADREMVSVRTDCDAQIVKMEEVLRSSEMEMQKRCEMYEEHLAGLQNDRRDGKEELDQVVVQLEEKVKGYEELLAKHQESSTENKTDSNELQKLKEKLACYELQLSDLDKLNEKLNQMKDLEAKYKDLNEAYTANYNKLHLLNEENHRLTSSVGLLENKCKDLTKSLEDLQDNRTDNDLSRKLERKLNSRNEKLVEFEQKVRSTEVSVSKLEGELYEKDKVIEYLKEKLKESEMKRNKMSLEVKQLRENENILLQQLNLNVNSHQTTFTPSKFKGSADCTLDFSSLGETEAAREVEKILSRVEREGAQVLELTEFMFLKSKASNLCPSRPQSSAGQLQSSAGQLQSSAGQLQSSAGQLQSSAGQSSDLQITALKRQIEEHKSQYLNTISVLQKCVSEKDEVIEALQTTLESSGSSARKEECLVCAREGRRLETLRTQLKEALSSRNEVTEANSCLKKELKEKKMTHLMKSLELNNVKAELNSEQITSQHLKDTIKNLESKLRVQEQQKEDLLIEVDGLKSELRDLQRCTRQETRGSNHMSGVREDTRHSSVMTQQSASLHTADMELLVKNRRQQEELSQERQMVASLKKKLEETETRLNAALRCETEGVKRASHSEGRLSSLKQMEFRELEQRLRQEHSRLFQEMERRITREKEILEIEKDGYSLQCSELKHQLRQMDHHMEQMTTSSNKGRLQEVESLSQMLSTKESENKELQSRCRKLEEECQGLQLKLQQESNHYVLRLSTMQQEIECLKQTESSDYRSLPFRPTDAIEDQRSRLVNTFYRYLKSQRCNRYLIWQKNYLLTVIKKFKKTEVLTVLRLQNMVHHTMLEGDVVDVVTTDNNRLLTDFRQLNPRSRFRVAALAIIVIHRIRKCISKMKTDVMEPFGSSYDISSTLSEADPPRLFSSSSRYNSRQNLSSQPSPPIISSTPPNFQDLKLSQSVEKGPDGQVVRPTATYASAKGGHCAPSHSSRIATISHKGMPIATLNTQQSAVTASDHGNPLSRGEDSMAPLSRGPPSVPPSHLFNLQSPPTKEVSTRVIKKSKNGRSLIAKEVLSTDCVDRHDRITNQLGLR